MNTVRLASIIEHPKVQNSIIGLIALNSVTIGLETSPAIMSAWGTWLLTIDAVILGVFVVETVIKLAVYRGSYFRSGWNVFDFIIIAIALLPASGALSVLRALRIFRSLRLIKAVPRLRFIVETLLHSLPSLTWIFVLLSLVFYVFAVVGTKMFGADHPEWFGDLGASMFTLFQIMTLEGWADIARTVQATTPLSIVYFLTFILMASYTTLNIFIAIVVNTMSEMQQRENRQQLDAIGSLIADERTDLHRDLRLLKEQIQRMEEKLSQPR
ncbi:MAG: ion transporter [Bacteroidetes bacterium]|jgi:voltage-gated sodium channel|nr:ion transporter [Bacteroidota bacterium]